MTPADPSRRPRRVNRPEPVPPPDAETRLHDELAATWYVPRGLIGWFRVVDHRTIGIRYISTAFVFFIAAGIMAIATHPRFVLLALAYSYLSSAFIGQAITRFRHRGGRGPQSSPHTVPIDPPARENR